MNMTRTRLVGVAAALSAIAIAAPASTAGAATPASAAPVTTVIGPTFDTTAPATFINTNTQVSSGDSTSGGQFAPA